MATPKDFRPGRSPVSAGQLNLLTQAIRDLQVRTDRLDPEAILDISRGRRLGKVLSSIHGTFFGLFYNQCSWDEWEIRDGVLQVKPEGIKGRMTSYDGWTDPVQNVGVEWDLKEMRPGSFVWFDEALPPWLYGYLPSGVVSGPMYVCNAAATPDRFTVGNLTGRTGRGISSTAAPFTMTGNRYGGVLKSTGVAGGTQVGNGAEMFTVVWDVPFLTRGGASSGGGYPWPYGAMPFGPPLAVCISPANADTAAVWGTLAEPYVPIYSDLSWDEGSPSSISFSVRSGLNAFPTVPEIALFFSIHSN